MNKEIHSIWKQVVSSGLMDEKFFEKSSELTSGVDISDMEEPLADK